MMFKYFTPIFLIAFSSNVFANDPVPYAGSSKVIFDIQANVPAMCSITNGYFSNTNIGTYYNAEISYRSTFRFNCQTNSKLEMTISLGNNPKSTPEVRRMNMDGAVGDVEDYLEYYILDHNKTKVGGSASVSVASDYYGRKDIDLIYTIPVQSTPPKIGNYSEELDLIVEYW